VDNLNPRGVAVSIRARHLCMESRGIHKQGHETITTAVRGAFKDNPAARAEFFSSIK
jgi:GTP cyclohydrolase I